MSKLHIVVSKIEKIEPHPNKEATKLEIATVLGWKTCIPKGSFKQGEKCVFIPYDTILTNESAEKLGVSKYLKGTAKNRVGRINLKGHPSFGIVTKPLDENWPVGKDVASEYGASKYFTPVKAKAGDAESENPLFPNLHNVENLRNFPNSFKDGESVWISEKCDGTSSLLGLINKEWMARSNNVRRKMPIKKTWLNWVKEKLGFKLKPDIALCKQSWFWFPYSVKQIRELLEFLSNQYKTVIIHGETYGNVQYLKYGVISTPDNPSGLEFRAFGLVLDGVKVKPKDMYELFDNFNIPTVPRIADKVPFNLEEIRKLSRGNTLINNAGHIREGVVVLSEDGQKSMKYVNDDYLMDKKAEETDTTDA